ncbi:HAD family hydrolase [Methanobrevibacter arboriphilus]|uniref:HAD family hydrolase n=1 Tax=Methanobrevibacter arboriphilus TaxID=39441 RepID=UPI0021E6CBC0|nr:HAD family hydrolase [Methanobrevibacter arboriphilus]
MQKKLLIILKKLDLDPVLLTGDTEKPAKHMADQVGIDQLYYNCLPETKMKVIDGYQDIKNELVAMVGDGVNDAPSLKKSPCWNSYGGNWQ